MKQQNKQQRKSKRGTIYGGAGDASYAMSVYPNNPLPAGGQHGAQGNVIDMNAAYATAQHNGCAGQSGGTPAMNQPIVGLSPAALTVTTSSQHGGRKRRRQLGGLPDLSPSTYGGKIDLTTMAVPAALLVANQMYSRRQRRSKSRLTRRRRRSNRRR